MIQQPDYMKYAIEYRKFPSFLISVNHLWAFLVLSLFGFGIYQFYIHNTAQRSPQNVVKAYYNALDFKEFETAHSFLDIEKEISIAQYMQEVSVTDGILSSYAKLDAMEIKLSNETDQNARAEVKTYWVTPLERIQKTYNHDLVKRQGKWYIEPSYLDSDIPPDQLFTSNSTTFYNHGRRKITTEQTHHEDVLKQPVLEVLSAKLVKMDGSYSVIGELQNVDNVPADVVLKATLYNDDDKELANYNAKFHMKHKLMPMETTTFKINFEGIAWSQTKDTIPPTFNPDEFTPVQFSEQPTKFNLQCAGNVANTDLYKGLVLQELQLLPNGFKGQLYNSGVQEVTIPLLLISYYDTEKNLLWVDHKFVREGVRVQRKQSFHYNTMELDGLEIVDSSLKNCFVNGLPNAQIAGKVIQERIRQHSYDQLQPLKGSGFQFIKLELNSYIGNPR